MARERWREIPDTHGRYQASDRGRIRSVSRPVNAKADVELVGGPHGARFLRWTRDFVEQRARPRVLRQRTKTNGYREIPLSMYGARRWCLVHRLVLLAFNGPPPPERPHGDHLNGCKADNRLENLRWVSPKENSAAAWERIYELDRAISRS